MRPNRSVEVRRFHRVALQRFEDSEILLDGGRNTGAIYLAGYAVECALKAIPLSATPLSQIPDLAKSFRGGRGHDLEWLKEQYLRAGRPGFPPALARNFARVNSWKTDIRYKPGPSLVRDAEEFIGAVGLILGWVEELL